MLARFPTRASRGAKDSTCGTSLQVCCSHLLSFSLNTFSVSLSTIYALVYLVFSLPNCSSALSPAFFSALGVLCFLAAMKQHSLTERVANYQENIFVLVVLDDSLDWSFWLGVGSIATHFAACVVVAMSHFKLLRHEVKKPEQPTISAVDLLYWRSLLALIDRWRSWQTTLTALEPMFRFCSAVI